MYLEFITQKNNKNNNDITTINISFENAEKLKFTDEEIKRRITSENACHCLV
jgi:hypothetical protein